MAEVSAACKAQNTHGGFFRKKLKLFGQNNTLKAFSLVEKPRILEFTENYNKKSKSLVESLFATIHTVLEGP